MHGRLKIRTTAEMQALNKKKEEAKAKFYLEKFDQIMEKRKNGELDQEMLTLTSEILTMNPDVSTLWNIRKETLLKMKSEFEDIDTVTEAELKLAEMGLRINPKSYGAWYHRCWVLDRYAENPNWEKELKICTKYLELDERNFLCWDYRRYVVNRHKTPLEDELDYSLQKLMSNFSNYSAWHYRSKLIPRVYSVFEREKLFENEIYKQEVSLVENAVYTDPNDQSAWFYHRWLLGHISTPAKIVQAGLDKDTVWVAIYPRKSNIQVKGFGETKWKYLDDDRFSNILVKPIAYSEKYTDVTITLYEGETVVDSIELRGSVMTKEASFKPILSDVEKVYVKQQLESYQQLANLETDNKWALSAINLIKEKLGEALDFEILEKLKSIDHLRSNYYSDLISRQKIEEKLLAVVDWTGSFAAGCMSLTALYHNYFFTCFVKVDLSGNPLGNNVLPKLNTLFSCKVLKLSNCQITCLSSFPRLPSLISLDISYNRIISESLPDSLLLCPTLLECNYEETYMSEPCIDSIVSRIETNNFMRI